jgi:hypothetical protein
MNDIPTTFQEYYAKKKSIINLLGKSILLSSMQFSLGSMMMSSTFSVKNFSKDQLTLQHSADALSEYLMIAVFWTLGTSFLFYVSYGWLGVIVNFCINLAIIIWITKTYHETFRYACNMNGLEMPAMFRSAHI